MKVVILGCGRVGIMLTQRLTKHKHDVTVIDWQAEPLRQLGKEFPGLTVLGTGIDEQNLRKAGIEKADAFIAVTNSDNTNLMATQVVKEKFKTPRIYARVDDPQKAQTFQEYGLNVICPTTVIADIFEKKLKSQP